MKKEENLMEKIVSLAKRRGFVFQGSEIYGGLSGTWDYGPYGEELKHNIKDSWWKRFVSNREDVFGIDAAILMNKRVWEATDHATTFADPVVVCSDCQKRFRLDELEDDKKCPGCGGELTEPRQFNMMFKTTVGAEDGSTSYLRPETAQGIFVNFKNIIDSMHPKMPFGIAQIGRAYRNEIAPRDFLFRAREFEQMEIEYFVKKEKWQDSFEEWRKETIDWVKEIGVAESKIKEIEVLEEDRAHYSSRTIDVEFEYSFGQKELFGLAYRGDFDLTRHSEYSKVDLSYVEEDGSKIRPHVIEPSFGVDRLVLAILESAYREDDMDGEKRVYLAFKPAIAPVKVAVFPLLKNKPELVKKAREVYETLRKKISPIIFDDNGNIGKRYRRQDEIGTPYCLTIDFDTLEDNAVTKRDRDTGKQERIKISELDNMFR